MGRQCIQSKHHCQAPAQVKLVGLWPMGVGAHGGPVQTWGLGGEPLSLPSSCWLTAPSCNTRARHRLPCGHRGTCCPARSYPHTSPHVHKATSTGLQVSRPASPRRQGRLSASAANSWPGRRATAQLLAASAGVHGQAQGWQVSSRAELHHTHQWWSQALQLGAVPTDLVEGVFYGRESGWRGRALLGTYLRSSADCMAWAPRLPSGHSLP